MYRNIGIIVGLGFGIMVVGYFSFWYQGVYKSDYEKEKNYYLETSSPIHYDVKKEFILEKYSQDKNTYLSGTTLFMDGKIFTGNLIGNISSPLIKDGSNYFIEINSVKKIDLIGGENQGEVKKTKININKKIAYQNLVGEKYKFDEKNISPTSLYTLSYFETPTDLYLVSFKDSEENALRDEKYQEYLQKVEEIKEKHWQDPEISNKLIGELNTAYNIEIEKLQ